MFVNEKGRRGGTLSKVFDAVSARRRWPIKEKKL